MFRNCGIFFSAPKDGKQQKQFLSMQDTTIRVEENEALSKTDPSSLKNDCASTSSHSSENPLDDIRRRVEAFRASEKLERILKFIKKESPSPNSEVPNDV